MRDFNTRTNDNSPLGVAPVDRFVAATEGLHLTWVDTAIDSTIDLPLNRDIAERVRHYSKDFKYVSVPRSFQLRHQTLANEVANPGFQTVVQPAIVDALVNASL